MEWTSEISTMFASLPSKVRTNISRALGNERPSSLFVITSCQTPEILVSVIDERVEDIVNDGVSLAHVRIVASGFLLRELVRSLQRLETHIAYFRSEAASAISNTAIVWQRISVRQSNSSLSRAERYEKHVRCIERVINVLHQFVGMHMEAVEDVHIALGSKRTDELERAILTSCRQASSFLHAVAQSTTANDLLQQVGDALRSSIGASPRREASNKNNTSGQLGQFWKQGGLPSTSRKRLGPHDVRLTLQILQTELTDLKNMRGQLRYATEREWSKPWDIQQKPVRYIGLASVTIASTHTVVEHSRLLGGTGLLEDKAVKYAHVLQGFVQLNIVEPIARFYQQIFRESPTSASEESVADTRSSLREMIIDFTQRNLSSVPGAEELARHGSMKEVMNLIKMQANHPLRNSLTGSLGQAIFLQVQKLKLDVEELMLKSKQLLRAQELNLALVALVPTLLTATILMYMISTVTLHWRSRDIQMIVSTAQTARFLLGDIHATLLLVESEGDDESNLESILQHIRHIGTIHVKTSELEEMIEKGLIRVPEKVRRRFLDDLGMLRSPGISYESRRKQIDRMMQCYQFLQGP